MFSAIMKPLILSFLALAGLFLAIALLAGAQSKQTFTGVVTDSMCPTGDHSGMRMGPTDAECTIACVMEHGATYVLFDGKATYDLSDQRTPEKFAGQRVTVLGTLNTKTKSIQVDSIVAAI
jgi:hypothetical protein